MNNSLKICYTLDMYYTLSLFHPITYLTIGLITGIFLFLFPTLLIFATIIFLMSLTLILPKCIPSLFYPYILFVVGLFAGLTRMYISCNKIPSSTPISPCSIRGTIADLNFDGSGYFKHTVTIDIHQYYNTTDGKREWCPYQKRIIIYTRELPSTRIGDSIEYNDIKISHPKKDRFMWYLLRDGIEGTAFEKKWRGTLITTPHFSAWRSIFEWRQSLIHRFKNKIHGTASGLFCSLFLGNKVELKKENKTINVAFKRWGIAHQLARSGLHLVIFITICLSLLHLIPFPFMAKQLLLIFFAACYFILSWPTISFARAALVFLLHKLCTLLTLPTHFLYILTLVCLLVLLHNPLHLFFLDFQLSFLFTFALLRVSHALKSQVLINGARLS